MRHQLPVYSPLSVQALLKGAVAALRNASGQRADLEEALYRRYKTRSMILTDSGTSALRLAFEAVLARSGGAIALPAYSCYDLATAAVGAGAPVVLYDVDPKTLGPVRSSLSRALEEGASAVVIAHLYGIPVELDVAQELCSAGGAILIEDAAQGFGAEYQGRPLGGHGSFGILSFGRGKGVTGGGGGALLANDEWAEDALFSGADRLGAPSRGWTSLFKSAVQWLLGRPSLYALPARVPILRLGETAYRTPWPPRGLSAMSAGLLSATLGLSETEVDRRRIHARRLLESLNQSGRCEPVEAARKGEPSYLRLPVLPRPESDFCAYVETAAGLGVMCGYPEPLHRLPVLCGSLIGSSSDLRGAERLASSLFTLPTHGRLNEEDLHALEAWIGRLGGP